MKRDVLLFIDDILDNINKIESFSKNLSKDKLLKKDLNQYAITRALEIIGEAVKNIPENIRTKYPAIPWRKIAGFRDIISHAYFGINNQRILEIIGKDLPDLKKNILKVKKELEEINNENKKKLNK